MENTHPSVTAEQMVRDTFSRSTESYSGLFLQQQTATSFCFRRRLELAVELSQVGSGRMLDCATGTGEITAAVLQNSRLTQATIVDISPEMLGHARAHIARTVRRPSASLQFVPADIFEFLPADSLELYDLVLCLGLIAHTGRLEELLTNMKSLLAPGGKILLQSTLLDHPGTRIVRALTAERYRRKHGYYIHYFTAHEIEEACKRCGLFIQETRRFAVGVPFGDKVWAKGNYRLETYGRNWAERHGSEAIYAISNRPW